MFMSAGVGAATRVVSVDRREAVQVAPGHGHGHLSPHADAPTRLPPHAPPSWMQVAYSTTGAVVGTAEGVYGAVRDALTRRGKAARSRADGSLGRERERVAAEATLSPTSTFAASAVAPAEAKVSSSSSSSRPTRINIRPQVDHEVVVSSFASGPIEHQLAVGERQSAVIDPVALYDARWTGRLQLGQHGLPHSNDPESSGNTEHSTISVFASHPLTRNADIFRDVNVIPATTGTAPTSIFVSLDCAALRSAITGRHALATSQRMQWRQCLTDPLGCFRRRRQEAADHQLVAPFQRGKFHVEAGRLTRNGHSYLYYQAVRARPMRWELRRCLNSGAAPDQLLIMELAMDGHDGPSLATSPMDASMLLIRVGANLGDRRTQYAYGSIVVGMRGDASVTSDDESFA